MSRMFAKGLRCNIAGRGIICDFSFRSNAPRHDGVSRLNGFILQLAQVLSGCCAAGRFRVRADILFGLVADAGLWPIKNVLIKK